MNFKALKRLANSELESWATFSLGTVRNYLLCGTDRKRNCLPLSLSRSLLYYLPSHRIHYFTQNMWICMYSHTHTYSHSYTGDARVPVGRELPARRWLSLFYSRAKPLLSKQLSLLGAACWIMNRSAPFVHSPRGRIRSHTSRSNQPDSLFCLLRVHVYFLIRFIEQVRLFYFLCIAVCVLILTKASSH